MSDTQTIGLFVNSRAGKGKANQKAATIAYFLSQQQIVWLLFETAWPDNLSAITEAWIIGGDGTLNYFINRYQPQIPLSVFPAGTGNDFHWQLYGKANTLQQANTMLNSTPQPIDVITCNNKWYLNSVGLGFDGVVLQSMQDIRNFGGHLGYLWIVLKNIFRFKEITFRITIDNYVIEQKYLLVVVNNAKRTGGGFLVTPKASLTDGLFDVMLCEALPVWKRLRYLPVIEKGKHLKLPFVQYHQTNTIKISCNKSIPGQMDGEFIAGTTFEFSVLPGRLLFK
jgi:YegS/Rv2252/BmrU family lipid kinase